MTTEPKRPRGRPKSPDARLVVSYSLPPDVVALLDKAAAEMVVSKSELVEFTLRRHLPQYL
jgi:hypothetical protein